MPNRAGIVIVGAGHGGFNAALALRRQGLDGRVSLIDRQAGLPYQRPPLSKKFMASEDPPESLAFRPESFFSEHDIDLVAGSVATDIDRRDRKVALSTGETLSYDHLILAMGAKARPLKIEGATLDGVHELRIAADAIRIRAALSNAETLVVIGAGFIGLEVAATAAALGKRVTVIELADRVLGRSATPELAAFVADYHRSKGLHLLLDARVSGIEGKDGRVTAVILEDGTRLPADLVIAGTGVVADDELARRANLPTDDGILVDAMLRTEDPAISAIGDIARFPVAETGQSLRLESVQNAVDQAKCVSARLTGNARPYGKPPWFWSDQGKLRLQIAGLSMDANAYVTAGDPATEKFSILCFRGGRLAAVESVNRPADHIAARQIFETGKSPSLGEVEKSGFRLKDIAKGLRTEP